MVLIQLTLFLAMTEPSNLHQIFINNNITTKKLKVKKHQKVRRQTRELSLETIWEKNHLLHHQQQQQMISRSHKNINQRMSSATIQIPE